VDRPYVGGPVVRILRHHLEGHFVGAGDRVGMFEAIGATLDVNGPSSRLRRGELARAVTDKRATSIEELDAGRSSQSGFYRAPRTCFLKKTEKT
jgi:hypothetical protein